MLLSTKSISNTFRYLFPWKIHVYISQISYFSREIIMYYPKSIIEKILLLLLCYAAIASAVHLRLELLLSFSALLFYKGRMILFLESLMRHRVYKFNQIFLISWGPCFARTIFNKKTFSRIRQWIIIWTTCQDEW